MAIEFRCPNCDKKLKTGDDKAGRAAKCPQCGTSVTVPGASSAQDEFDEFPSLEDAVAVPRRAAPSGQIACPMCGATNDTAAERCYACGEDLFAGPLENRRVPPRGYRDIWNAAWEKWTTNLGINVASALIAGAMYLALYVALIVLMIAGIGLAAVADPAAGGVAVVLVFAGFYLLFFLVYAYLLTGLANFAVRQVRSREVGLGAMFPPIGKLGPALLGTFITSLVITATGLPGIGVYVYGNMLLQEQEMSGVLIVMFGYFLMLAGMSMGWTFVWPVQYMIADRSEGWITPIGDGIRLAVSNVKLSFLLGLTHAGLLFVGFLTCNIGLLFTMPLSFLLFAVAYVRCDRAARVAADAGTGNLN